MYIPGHEFFCVNSIVGKVRQLLVPPIVLVRLEVAVTQGYELRDSYQWTAVVVPHMCGALC